MTFQKQKTMIEQADRPELLAGLHNQSILERSPISLKF